MQIVRLVSEQEQLPDVEFRGNVIAEPPRPAARGVDWLQERRWEVRDAVIPDALSTWTALPNIEGVVDVYVDGAAVRLTKAVGVGVVGGVVHIVGYAG